MSLNYLYDANGNLTTLWSGTLGGLTNVYGYDALNRLIGVQADGSSAASYGFDGVGNLQSGVFGNGVTNLYQYDKLNRLTNAVWNASSNLASFAYQLGLTGNRIGLTETLNGNGQNYLWHYDQVYRLTNEIKVSVGQAHYALDAVGNRLSRTGALESVQSFAYNTNDWLTTDAYDSNGNTLASTNGTTVGPYEYDAENHLTNFNNTVSILYNGDGVRVMKSVGGTNTYYLVDDRNPTGYPQVVKEWAGTGYNGTLSRVYNYGMSLVSQREASTGTVHYYGMDGHGSVRFLTDTNGAITDTYTYDAYGNLVATTGSTVNPYLYCCYQYDFDLGMYYLSARYYQPNTGRFWTDDTYEGSQEDPLSLHKYLFCEANPVNMTDPDGHDGELAETLSALTISTIVETTVATVVAIDLAELPFKTWTIYEGINLTPFHAYIVASESDNISVYRYDIAVSPRVAVLAVRNPLKTYTAYLQVHKYPRAEALTGLRVPVGRLSNTIFDFWNWTVTGRHDVYDGLTVPKDYVLAYQNCLTYSTWYAARAAVLTAVPF